MPSRKWEHDKTARQGISKKRALFNTGKIKEMLILQARIAFNFLNPQLMKPVYLLKNINSCSKMDN